MIHDMDCDGRISPKDVVDFHARYCSETNYLIPFDVEMLTRKLKAKMATEPLEANLITAESILEDVKKKLKEREGGQPEEKSEVVLSPIAKPVIPPVPGKMDKNESKLTQFSSIVDILSSSIEHNLSQESVYKNLAAGMNKLNTGINRQGTVYEKKQKLMSL